MIGQDATEARTTRDPASPSRLNSVEELIDDARNGRMFILVDDEDRENEGDLVIPAQMATPDAINFMAFHGRGLICLSLTRERAAQLKLEMMSRDNRAPLETAFTVSIEAREGVTTGISAADRARTIAVVVDASNGPEALVSPGHVFPLVARDGGVLVRAGHTEAAVDLARLAGLTPAGVICEIMNDDGTMARFDDLIAFAGRHGLKIGTIADLIAFRRRHDHLVERISTESFVSRYGGDWDISTFRNKVDGSECYVLRKGAADPRRPTLVRVHNSSVFDDLLGRPSPQIHALQRTMAVIGAEGAGLILVFPFPRSQSAARSYPGVGAEAEIDLRTYGIGAQILAEMKVRDMVLLTNSPKPSLKGLDAFGVNIVGTRPLPPEADRRDGSGDA